MLLQKNIVIYLILIITNKKKLEFAYCDISCGKFITAGITLNILSEIVVALVGYPFVDFVGHPFVGSLDQLVIEPEK
ncbi:hypothetical protein CN327_09725 [Bacillus cereus]|nr:hypothetical protein CON53_21320 [Bacillus cereus]PES76702.1 hypothetical protein CN509_17015 [Bacillus cereus]PET08261.1 hypothetical protein CN505_06915 [Bacillus cereus]PFF34456.1 hypothetical protein CN327_09725 [Bacillus cereus]PFH92925.1 hypothetical protein COI81_04410 [Bacillus cereus]